MEGTVLLSPLSYDVPPAEVARTANRPAAHVNTETASKGIGSRLGPSAQLIDQSIDELRALDR
ncbi:MULTISPECIES: hypothetical protein [unclassified Kribbella]|uniref:hypothetical protein n=1 Tax=unclassified Kribbella TaxID=2644121 RepID=UPI003076E651